MDPVLKEEKREMKRLKAENDMLDYVAYAEYGIPTRCPCGGGIVTERAPGEAFDSLPGKRFFTCTGYKPDGLHFRQPWVCGVEEEIKNLTRRVEEAEKLTWRVYDMDVEMKKLKEEVANLKMRVAVLEKSTLTTTET